MSGAPTRMTGRARESGFTLLELLMYAAIAGFVLTGILQLIMGQGRAYAKQRELMDVHASLRAAAALLAWEFRQAAAADGDLYGINANSITLRSVWGEGTVCTRHSTKPRFGLTVYAGDGNALEGDSAIVFAAGASGLSDDAWQVLEIQSLSVGSQGMSNCAWSGYGQPDVSLNLSVGAPNDTAGVAVGAPVRLIRQVKYGLYHADGRWWLGRKVGGAASYEKLTGPLQAANGLVFRYYDAAGTVTADPSQVAVIEFVLRAESYGGVQGRADRFQQDSLATKVALRG